MAEVCDLDNEQLVRMVGLDRVETVVSHDMIGRLMLLCARQPGLAIVWESIIGFEGRQTLWRQGLNKSQACHWPYSSASAVGCSRQR